MMAPGRLPTIFATTLLAASTPALIPDVQASWNPQSSQHRASGQDEASALFSRFPGLFWQLRELLAESQAEGSVARVLEIDLRLDELHWKGPTRCSPDDPRLTLRASEYTATVEQDGALRRVGESGCLAEPAPVDPCSS